MSKERMLKKGDKVVMHTCGEATFSKYYGKVWTCKTDEFITGEGKGLYEQRLVFLEGFSGSFATDYLQYIDLEEMQKALQFYAEPTNHDIYEINEEQNGIVIRTEYWTNVMKDNGEIALQALKGISNE